MSTQQHTTVTISPDGTKTTTTRITQQSYGGTPCQQSSWTKTYTYGNTGGCPRSNVMSSQLPTQTIQQCPYSNTAPVNACTAAKTVDDTSSDQCEKEGSFEKEFLDRHNMYRAKHRAQPLKLSKSLCNYSLEWANKLAREDGFYHRNDHKYGENLYMSWSSNPNQKINGADAVDSWYKEIKDYRGQFTSNAGHFSQVVWKDSKMLGVGVGRSRSGKVIVVANYDPAGNMMGRFQENVSV